MKEHNRFAAQGKRRPRGKGGGGRNRPVRSKKHPPRSISELSYEQAGPDLTKAYLVTIGSDVGEEVVVDIPNQGQFRAYLNENFFCTGAGRRGRLMKEDDLHIFVSRTCTQTEAQKFIASLKCRREALEA